MTSRRGSGRGWEVRLGALQVVVWLGLALGAVFGAYFIGFFSGRYVGFEIARATSGVEVPKLALTDEYPEKNAQAMANVMGKLNDVATLNQDAKPAAVAKAPAADARIAKVVQDSKQEASSKSLEDEGAAKGNVLDQDSIFSAKISQEPSEVEIAEQGISGNGGTVRVLGRDSSNGAVQGGEEASTVANRRAAVEPAKQVAPAVVALEQPKAVVEQKVPAKIPVKAPVKEPKKEKITVVKKLSKGHFAQVGSPKNLAEAEGLARNLRRSGFLALIEETSKGKSPFYRVVVGPEDNKVQADRLVAQLKREPYIKGTIFVRTSK